MSVSRPVFPLATDHNNFAEGTNAGLLTWAKDVEADQEFAVVDDPASKVLPPRPAAEPSGALGDQGVQLVERNTVDAVLGRGDDRDPVDPAPDFNERIPFASQISISSSFRRRKRW